MTIDQFLLITTSATLAAVLIRCWQLKQRNEILKDALKSAISELRTESYRLRLLEAQGRDNVAVIPDVKKHISTCIADCQAVAQISGRAFQ